MILADSQVLIVAVSGRALAQSARRGGYAPVVLDYFADEDTRAVSASAQSVVSPRGLRFERRKLLAAAAQVPAAPLVYGSGLEGRIPLLARLAEGRRVYGNPPEIVARTRDPRQFFPLLQRLKLPYPEIAFTAPPSLDGWLVKQPGGAGGTHVRLASSQPRPARAYYQRLSDGVPMSVLFLADGTNARIVGFNEQWTASQPGRPFLFGGAVSRAVIPDQLRSEVTTAVNDLVAALGLHGLNGLDFLLHGARWSILEVNPRPTATMELYDADYAAGLFHAHLRAAQGHLVDAVEDGPSRAAMIAHALHDWTVPAGFRFPVWCSDIPRAGTPILAGQPICTMHAEAPEPGVARALVLDRQLHLDRVIRDQRLAS